MAKTTSTHAAVSDIELTAPSKAPMIAVVALVAVNLLGTGLIAVKVMKLSSHAPREEHRDESVDKAPGPVVALDTFVVNLNEPGSNRYLKTTFEVEVVDLAAQKDLEEHKRLVRDEMLSYLSNLTLKETMGEANKTKIREDLTERADKAVGGRGKVKHLFFTEFVVQ